MNVNYALVTSLFTNVVILDGQLSMAELLKLFATNISKHWIEILAGTSDSSNDNSSKNEDEAMKNKKKDTGAMDNQETEYIYVDCDDILYFFQ